MSDKSRLHIQFAGVVAEKKPIVRDKEELELMLKGYGLTTANILYHMPDHPHLLQSYIWQEYDLMPRLPHLSRFIDFWRETIEGPLHSVQVAHKRLISPSEWRNVKAEFVIN